MPEEINRRLTNHLAKHLFTTTRNANENLEREGIPPERVSFVGNTMIDTLLRFREAAARRETPAKFGVGNRDYAVLTLHRPTNVDDHATLARVLDAVRLISSSAPVIFPGHPRTRSQLAGHALEPALTVDTGVVLCEPLGYLDFIGLIGEAKVVLTDSGGIQEEPRCSASRA